MSTTVNKDSIGVLQTTQVKLIAFDTGTNLIDWGNAIHVMYLDLSKAFSRVLHIFFFIK